MATQSRKKTKQPAPPTPRTLLYCRKCQKKKKTEDFYVTTNPKIDSNGYMSICKECCGEIFDFYNSVYKNVENAIYETCRDLDIAFKYDCVKSAQAHLITLEENGKKATSIFGWYKSKISSIYADKGENLRFKDSDELERKYKTSTGDTSESEVTKDMVDFWGEGFTDVEYFYLDAQFNSYLDNYEVDSPVLYKLFQQACYEELNIRNARMKRNDVSGHLKTLQSILGDASVKPNQETGANATDANTYGMWIKKLEDERPVSEPSEEWADVDGIKKLIRVYFLGHLCKIMGIKNEYSEEYEAEMAKFRVEMPSEDLIDETLEIEEGV